MAKKPPFKLAKTDTIVTAYAQFCAGPGWSNSPLFVIVRSKLDGKLREECIQPEDQTEGIVRLFQINNASHQSMMTELAKIFK